MLKKKRLWIALLLILILFIPVTLKLVCPKKNYIRATYLPLYKNWSAESIEGDYLTHIYLAFATLGPDFSVSFNPHPSLNLKQEIETLHTLYPELKINVSIGGWGVDGFSQLAATPETRKLFADNVIKLLKEYNLDGVDIDWEYPGQSSDGLITCSPDDPQNFVLLLKELRLALDAHASTNAYELSIAAPMSDWALESLNIAEAVTYVDYIHLMGYDYIGAWSLTTGHHSNWNKDKHSPTTLNSSEGINRYLTVCPPEKLILGIPAYGYGWSGVPPQDNGLYQIAKQALSPNEMDLSYSTIIKTYTSEKGFQTYWDDTAKSSYLYNGDIWISFDNPFSITYKADCIKSLGLAGMMYWEYTQDDTGELLHTIFDALH
ncbi:MAG: glycoside hydrolase family 18 protein [Cellulosilyticaceae bacterium]